MAFPPGRAVEAVALRSLAAGFSGDVSGCGASSLKTKEPRHATGEDARAR